MAGVERIVDVLRRALLADQRLGEALRIVHVVEAEPALDAEALVVRRPVLAGDVEQLVVLDLIGELAADAAIGAHRVDLAVGVGGADVVLVDEGRRHQRAGRAGLDAFAAGDAGRVPHRIVEVEHDLLGVAAAGHADDVVDLHLAAGADAQVALDAGVEIDRHRGVAAVGRRRIAAFRKPARGEPLAVDHLPQMRLRIGGDVALRLVGEEKLRHHLPRAPWRDRSGS